MSPTLQSILGPETLAAFETPGPVLRGLPAAAYTSEAFFALENERLFSESWVFAGFAHELPGRGDAAPVTVAGRPMLLVRCADHEVRAFHPPCFGRRDPGPAPAGFDREQHGPVPAKVETWYDWIFINLNGNGPPFEEFVARLLRRLDGLDLASMQHLVTIDLGEVAANWKLLIENFFEPHHGQLAHAATASQPLADRYMANDPGCSGCATDVSGEAKRTDTLSADSRYLTLFPNFVFGLPLPDRIDVHLNMPLAPDRTLQRRAIYSLGPDPSLAERKEQLVALRREAYLEARIVSEWLQQERGSDAAAEGGVLSPVWEDTVRSFQELVVSRLR